MRLSAWAAQLPILIVAAVASSAGAEIARLQTGPNTFGQGWLFLDRDARCKVLTAGHVVARGERPVRAIVRDRRGRELETDPPEIFSLSPDIAVLPVRVGPNPGDCSRSRLSMIGIDRRLQFLTGGVIETTGQSEALIVPVERSATRIDRAGGEMFAVRPRDAAVRVVRGWSGSIVRDGDGPLGVVFAVNAADNEASAVRVDVLSRLKPGRPQARKAGSFTTVHVTNGETLDPEFGPRGLLDRTQPAWRVRPDRGQVSIVLTADRPQTIRRVVIEQPADAFPALRGVNVEAGLDQRNATNFLAIRSCSSPTPVRQLSCEFLEQERSAMKISIVVNGSDPISVRRVSLD